MSYICVSESSASMYTDDYIIYSAACLGGSDGGKGIEDGGLCQEGDYCSNADSCCGTISMSYTERG